MTKEEKLEKLRNWCDALDKNILCEKCILHKGDGTGWCDLDAHGVDSCPEEVMDEALAIIKALEEPIPVTEEHTSVNHPSHYNQEGAMECIEEMILIFGREAVMHFCLCNAWKYRYRANEKNGKEDMDKANWYIKKYKELSENGGY